MARMCFFFCLWFPVQTFKKTNPLHPLVVIVLKQTLKYTRQRQQGKLSFTLCKTKFKYQCIKRLKVSKCFALTVWRKDSTQVREILWQHNVFWQVCCWFLVKSQISLPQSISVDILNKSVLRSNYLTVSYTVSCEVFPIALVFILILILSWNKLISFKCSD